MSNKNTSPAGNSNKTGKSGKLPQPVINTIAVVRGLAFALVTAVYFCLPIQDYLWCVYVGFFLTMALGTDYKRMPSYICSLLSGYAWAFLYLNAGGWLAMLLPLDVKVCVVIAEFILTAGLLFIHLTFFAGGLLGTVPAIFAAVATIFASGIGMSAAPAASISVIIGILMGFGTTWVIDKANARRVQKNQ